MEAVQRDPAAARNQRQAKLSSSQRKEFEAALDFALRQQPRGAKDRSYVDPTYISRRDPIRLPYIHEDRVYLATLGHFTVGERYFADWDVTFETLDDGKLVLVGEFPVGMTKGNLRGATFSTVR